MKSIVGIVFLCLLPSACRSHIEVPCTGPDFCTIEFGGVCAAGPSGDTWCQYPDGTCASGMRWSDFGTGDGLSGQCVEVSCDPVTQAGCGQGWRCTWLRDGQGGGNVACVREGTQAVGEACQVAPDGTGPDDYTAGLICVSGQCRPICDPAAPVCASQSSCVRYSDLFGEPGRVQRLVQPHQPADIRGRTSPQRSKDVYSGFNAASEGGVAPAWCTQK